MHFVCYAFYLYLLFLSPKFGIINCCTNLIVTPAASSDGSLFVAYNADDTELMGLLYHYPATKTNETGKRRKIYNWDTGAHLGEIPEANITFNVVGNTNEFGLVIGETTWHVQSFSSTTTSTQPEETYTFSNSLDCFLSFSFKGAMRTVVLLKRGPFLIMDL
jgi:dipeptidase